MIYLIKNQKGLTLIELLVAIAIFSIVIAGMMTSKIQQQDQHITQVQAVEMQQSVRAVMFLMKRELRTAGYNPVAIDYGEGIASADATSITFSALADADGNLNTVSYAFADSDGDGDGDITVDINGGGATTLAENIQNLTFTYFDGNGNALISPVASPEDIRSMQISITSTTNISDLARADAGNTTRTLNSTVYLRNMGL